ncbi:MAG TPA: hypothetical protein VJN42_00250 [Candidatus Acidoferrum sp.]|nr:hypothetical protein [Candidatus Acidoferrum sp.]
MAFSDNSIEGPASKQGILRIRVIVWTAAAIVGFVQAWSLRFIITPDGNSYLDIANAYLRGDFRHAINASWSPMYSWLIAVTLRIFHPAGYFETTLLHLLNLGGMLIALRSFEFFFVAFRAFLKRMARTDEEFLLADASWWLLGYGLFFSTSLFVLTMEPITPDVWVCVVSYLAVGILLRIALQPDSWAYLAALGFVLGIAYLTKSFYFPLSFVFLMSACLAGGGLRRRLARSALALFIFVLVAGPFVLALSRSKQRFTYGDIGNIAFAMFLNRIDQISFWHGENNSGVPKHPTRQILASPRVFEFATPVGGTYPPGYDLSYWTEGIRPHFNVRGQLRILRQSFGTLFQVILLQSEFAVGFFVLLIAKDRFRHAVVTVARIWPLWLAPLAGCAGYSLVLTEARYVAPFIVFLWLALFASVLRQPSAASRRIATAVVLGILAFTGMRTVKYFVSDVLATRGQRNINWEVGMHLREIGIQPGDTVSVIASREEVHWARLAGVRIVAELPLGQDGLFWAGDDATQERVFDAIAKTGAVTVVVRDAPPGAVRRGWIKLGDTPYYAYLLKRTTGSDRRPIAWRALAPPKPHDVHERGFPTKFHFPQAKDSCRGSKYCLTKLQISFGWPSHRSYVFRS